MAIEFVAQRLQLGDVVLIDIPEQGEVEATVAREIVRTAESVRVTSRAEGREDFVKEWALGEIVTVVRGP
jgi:16S rRNA C1402 (ribose-2'-O) methylase RsmI